jgi:hypothetical protein
MGAIGRWSGHHEPRGSMGPGVRRDDGKRDPDPLSVRPPACRSCSVASPPGALATAIRASGWRCTTRWVSGSPSSHPRHPGERRGPWVRSVDGAGIMSRVGPWVPACAGMTEGREARSPSVVCSATYLPILHQCIAGQCIGDRDQRLRVDVHDQMGFRLSVIPPPLSRRTPGSMGATGRWSGYHEPRGSVGPGVRRDDGGKGGAIPIRCLFARLRADPAPLHRRPAH